MEVLIWSNLNPYLQFRVSVAILGILRLQDYSMIIISYQHNNPSR